MKFMKIEIHGDTMRLLGVRELETASASAFNDAVKQAMTASVKNLEIDLSQVSFLDSCGLGALVAVRKLVGRRGGVVRLLNPPAAAQQMLELTRLYRVLEVVNSEEVAATTT
jgi:anti-anti-sigma factor